LEARNRINNFLEKRDISNKLILNIIIALPALFLLVNNYPYLMILSIMLILLLGLIFFLIKPAITVPNSTILSILIIIYIYFILSYLYSGQPVSNVLTYDFFRKDGSFFFCYIPFFILAIPFFNYKKTVNLFFNFLFFTFSIFSIFGFAEYLIGKTSITLTVDPGKGKLFTALNFAHNATGSVYAVVSLFALIFFLNEAKKKIKLLYLIVFIICIAGLFLTKSMGTYIGFIVALIPLLWMNYRKIKNFSISVSIFIVASVPFIFLSGIYKRILQIINFSPLNNNSELYTTVVRLELWQKAGYLFLKSPIFGVGFGRFDDIEPYNYQRLKGIPGILSLYTDSNFVFSSSNAHNSYLQLLAETGIVGLGLLILFWVLCFRIIYKAYNYSTNIYYKRIYLCALAGIIALFVMSFTENYFSAITVMICISMVTSLSIGLFWQEKKEIGLIHSKTNQNLI
jgi:O-antigen ligase